MSSNLPATNEHFELSTTGLSISGSPSYEEWERMGKVLGSLRDTAHWAIGDWIIYGEGKYGERYSQALDETGYAYQTLRNDVAVASKFEMSRRRDNLPWGFHAEVAALPVEKQDDLLNRAESEGWTRERLREERGGGAHVGHNSGENEWYTPEDYIEAARRTLGRIDLDPASCHEANEVIKAKRYYDSEQDGLIQRWEGKVWMNPPYAQPLIEQFCRKLVDSFDIGDVSEACVLVNNATETAWFQAMAEKSSAMCFPCGRVRFWHPERKSAPLQGQAVIYIGKHPERFLEAFDGFGFVCTLP